jgi:hypothetical protein
MTAAEPDEARGQDTGNRKIAQVRAGSCGDGLTSASWLDVTPAPHLGRTMSPREG